MSSLQLEPTINVTPENTCTYFALHGDSIHRALIILYFAIN